MFSKIVNNVVPVLDLPVWVARTCLLLLALGFPLAIFFAWMRELPAAETASPVKATEGWLIGPAVGVAIALLVP